MENSDNYLHILPDISILDNEEDWADLLSAHSIGQPDYSYYVLSDIYCDNVENEDSAFGSMSTLCISESDTLKDNIENTSNITGEDTGDLQIKIKELNVKIGFLKTELDGARKSKLNIEKNYWEVKDKCTQLNQWNRNLKDTATVCLGRKEDTDSENRQLKHENNKLRRNLAENINVLNDLSRKWNEIQVQNERNCYDLNNMRYENLNLAQQLCEMKNRKPEVEVRYIESAPKPKWLQDFEDIQEEELTQYEKNYIMNSLPTKRNRLFIVRNVNRRRNGDFESYAEKNAKTQKYITYLKNEQLAEMENMRAEFEDMIKRANNNIGDLQYELKEMSNEILDLNETLKMKEEDTQETKVMNKLISEFKTELARIKCQLESANLENERKTRFIERIKKIPTNNSPAKKGKQKGKKMDNSLALNILRIENEEKVVEAKSIDVLNVYGNNEYLYPDWYPPNLY